MMPDRRLEFGIGGAVVSPRPYAVENWRSAGQLWASHEPTRVVGLTLLAAFDDEALALGGALRLRCFRSDRFAAAAELELGYLWGAISAPLSLRLFDQTWLYAAPRLGNWGVDPLFGVPVGASIRLYDGFVLRAEWQPSWQSFKYYNRRNHFGLAIAYQF
jgi:hypothetical protein